jgi:triacylglycerol lipase
MGAFFNCVKSIVLWFYNIRLGQIVLLCLFGILMYLGWITYRSWNRDGMKPQPDGLIDNIPHFDKRLDAFRAQWDIKGRFEAWPAVLPLAEMSNTAYLAESEAKRLFEQYGLASVCIYSPFHSQCAYVAHGEDVVVVVFRGTDDTEDWFFNANTYPHPMAEGTLHCGFACAYGTLRSQVLDEVRKAKAEHIWVTGHSLGGAMALVCAYDLTVYQKCKLDGVITFGQPMIGKTNLATFLQGKLGDRYVHFINEMDSVPQIPPRYSHFGCALQFLNGKILKSADYCPKLMKSAPDSEKSSADEYVPIDTLPQMNEKEFEEFLRKHHETKDQKKWQGPPQATMDSKFFGIPFPWVDDHSMDLYVDKIRAAIDKATAH